MQLCIATGNCRNCILGHIIGYFISVVILYLGCHILYFYLAGARNLVKQTKLIAELAWTIWSASCYLRKLKLSSVSLNIRLVQRISSDSLRAYRFCWSVVLFSVKNSGYNDYACLLHQLVLWILEAAKSSDQIINVYMLSSLATHWTLARMNNL